MRASDLRFSAYFRRACSGDDPLHCCRRERRALIFRKSFGWVLGKRDGSNLS
jgi:hypothetical protein